MPNATIYFDKNLMQTLEREANIKECSMSKLVGTLCYQALQSEHPELVESKIQNRIADLEAQIKKQKEQQADNLAILEKRNREIEEEKNKKMKEFSAVDWLNTLSEENIALVKAEHARFGMSLKLHEFARVCFLNGFPKNKINESWVN